MARGPRARPQRRRPGRRPCRAGPGILVPGRPMNDRPDASEARLTTGAGTGPDADAELGGTGLAGAGPTAGGPDADPGPAATGQAPPGPRADGQQAGTRAGPGTEAVA